MQREWCGSFLHPSCISSAINDPTGCGMEGPQPRGTLCANVWQSGSTPENLVAFDLIFGFLDFFFLNACFNCSHENYYPEVKGEEFWMALSAEKAKAPKCILQTTKPQALLFFFFFSGLAITPFPQIIVLVVAGGCCNWWLYLSAMVEEWQIKMDKFPPVWTDSLSLELLMDQALAKGG